MALSESISDTVRSEIPTFQQAARAPSIVCPWMKRRFRLPHLKKQEHAAAQQVAVALPSGPSRAGAAEADAYETPTAEGAMAMAVTMPSSPLIHPHHSPSSDAPAESSTIIAATATDAAPDPCLAAPAIPAASSEVCVAFGMTFGTRK